MFEWLDSLSTLEAVFFAGAIIIVNLIYIFWMRWNINRFFEKTGSAEKAINRYRILSQYAYMIIVCLSSFFIVLLFLFQLEPFLEDSPLHILISLVATFLFLGTLLTINQVLLSTTIQKIRETEETVKEEISNSIKGLLFTFVPIAVTIFVMQHVPDDFLGGAGIFLVPMVFIAIIPIFSSLLLGKMLKAYEMPDSEIKEQLVAFLQKTDIHDVKLMIWPTKKSKVANALVTGFLKKKQIFITDYLLENMTIKEVEAILAHEIGHIKHHHLWKRVALILVFPALMFGVGSGMDWFEERFTDIPVWIGFSCIVVIFVVYFIIAFNFFVRVQERQADEYVLTTGVDYRDFASSLLKLAKLNHMTTKMNKVDESFQTHPSIAKRIHWIIREAGGSVDEVERL